MQTKEEKRIIEGVNALTRRKEFLFLEKLEKEFPKGEVYLVGGAVRDMACTDRGRTASRGSSSICKDYDFIVRNVPAKKLQAFLATRGRVDLVGTRFGVLKFVPEGWRDEAIDIALPRTDHALTGGGGYKDFDIQTDATLPIEDDLARRDFTVNAIAVRLKNQESRIKNQEVDRAHGARGKRHEARPLSLQERGGVRSGEGRGRGLNAGEGARIIDPFGGLADLRAKTLRTVGKPETRFAEDYSRMLRGLRFACQLNVNIEEKTWNAIQTLMPRINRKRGGDWLVPREAIGRELIKSFRADPLRTIDLWDESGAFARVCPEVLAMKGCPQPVEFHSEGDVWRHSVMAVAELMSARYARTHPDVERNAQMALLLFLHDIGKPPTVKTPAAHGVDRVRTNEHDTTGAKIARDIAERLRLSQFSREDTMHHVDVDLLEWMIAKHMILSERTARAMKAVTLERYFLRDRYKGNMLKALIWCDSRATIAKKTGKPNLEHLRILNIRLARIEKQLARTRAKPLLSGDDVMHIAQISASPYVGQLLEKLREQQLIGKVRTKKQAQEFIRSVASLSL